MHVFTYYTDSGVEYLTTMHADTAAEWIAAGTEMGVKFDYFYMTDPER